MDVMAPDVVLIADGGGIAAAARVPIHGAEAVANLLPRAHRVLAAFETTTVWWWRTGVSRRSTPWQTHAS